MAQNWWESSPLAEDDKWWASSPLASEKKRDRGLIEDVKDIGTALVEGVPSLGRRLKAAGQAVIGDLTGVEATAKAEREAATTSNAGALATFKEDLAQRRQSSDGSWSQAAKNVGGAIAETPAALPQLVAEQAPNAAVTLGAGAAGFKAGMAAAPFLGPLAPLGPIAGGLLGLWLGNTAVETGGKAIEKAEGGFTPTERGETLREGAVKGAVVTGVDAITFGATKLLYSPVGKAMEKAGTDALVRSGVDVTARESVEAALKDTTIRESVEAAQIAALKQANAGGRGVARGTGAFGLQTVGEGAGEGFGEYAATGQVDPTDVLLESVAGAGQSAIEIGIAKSGRGARGLIDGARTPPPDPDAQLDQVLNRVEQARNEVFLGTSDGKQTLADIVAAPDLGAAIDAAEASVPSMADLLQQKRTTAAERVAQELGIEPAANFPTAEQIIGGAPIPGIDVGPAGDSTRPSVFGQSAGTPGLQPGETRILTQPSVFAEPSAGTPGLQPGETRVLTPPSVFEAPSAEADPGRLATLRAGVDRDAELLARRDGTPAAQPPEQMLRNAQRLEESARLIESNPRAPEAVLQRAQALREQAQSLRARAEEIAASAPAEQAGAMTQFEREQIDAQRQVNQEKRLPTRGEQPAATIVDSTPMTQVQAQQRLAVVQDQSGQPLSFQIVPHPTQSGAFAIAQRPMPAAADLEMTGPAPAQVSAAEAQNRIESAELGGREQQRKRLDEARQIVVTRALKNVEERNGVASPQEAQIFQEAGLGKPYDRVDESLAPKPGLVLPRMEMAGPKTTQAGIELGTAGTFGTQARLERGANVPKDKGPLPDTTNVNLAGQVGATEQQNETLLGEPRDPGTELAKARAAAGYDATLAQAPRPKSVNGQPVAGLSNEQLQAIAANAALPNVVRRGASIEIAHRAAELPTSGKLKFSEQRTDAAPEATQQGKPVSSLGNITTVDPTTLPNQSRAQPGAMSRQTHRMVSLLGSMFGKKVVVFDSDNDAAPDGFVRRGDSRTIYLNRKSEISHLVVFGHELLHQLKADNPQAYAALVKVIKLEAGVDTNVPGIRGDMEELTADIVGNRFREVEFWQDVFREILASGKDTKVSQRSAMKLGASVVRAVDRMVKALKGMTGFNTDEMVSNLQEVKSAVTKALASYAQEKRGEATELIRQEVAGQQAPAADTTGEVVASDKRGRLDNVEAYRYGKTARTFVNGSSFGAGLKGSSRDMYMNAEDKRLKQRVYFYFDKGTGINPEAGVGPIPHRAFLNNVYDADADPQKLVAGNQLKTESNILDAGFDGYLNRLGGTQSGQVIMFGLKPIPVEALQPGQKVRSGTKVEPLKTSAPTWTTQSSSGSKSMLEQKLERMRGNPSWASYDMQIVGTTPGMYELQTKLKADVVASEKRQVNTPEFKRWFGESKVVDGRGRPLVVYHGMTGEMEGGTFRSSKYGTLGEGVYFTSDPGAAGRFATGVRGSTTEPKVQGSTVPAYLKLEQPFDDEFFVGNKAWQEWAASIISRGYDTNIPGWTSFAGRDINRSGEIAEALHDKLMRGEATIRDLLFLNGDSESSWGQEILEKIKAHGGFDGVTLKDSPKGFDEYVVFKPTQIKSAIGNSGAFDPNDPDIRKSEKRILLNIGLSTQEMRGGGMLTEDVVRSALAKLGLKVDSMPVHPSDTEPTAVPAIDRPLTQEEGDDLSARLNQEAIVQRMPDGSGMLFGPKADEWGPYNPAYFVMADGKYAIEYEIQASAKRKRLDPEVVQTLGRHIRNLLPDEKAKLRRDTAQKMVDIIEGLPQASEMAAVAYAGRAKRGWYYNSAQAIEQVFGGDGPRFAALLAALSPQTSVESNLYNTLATWKNWVQAGRPTDRDTIVSIMGRSVQGSGTEASVLDAWKNNAVRALTANDPSSVTISGPKVNSFMLNLRGYVDEVTNDAWMANYALVDQKIFSGKLNAAGTDPGKTPGYLAMSARVREAAKVLSRLTGETWTPAEVQETVWSWAKTLYESASVDKSAADIVRNKEITDELIRATPDFRTLFNTDVNERLLRDAGLGDQVERLRAGGDLGGAGQQGAATGGQAAPFAADAQQRYELRAARRLDRLREQRAAGDEVVASEKREVASLFKGLQESRGLGRVRALERVDAHPLGATIRQIDADFLDILDRLDTAGLVKINCK